jgi:tetratricopeptide (TPR) repeat protein
MALARALLLEKTADGLAEAESIASQELRLKPDDGQLLMLRGAIREALGRRFEAAEDMRRALRTEGVVMADPQRQDAERRTALLLLAEDPKKAKEFIDGLPPMQRDRDFLVVLGRVEIALGDKNAAVLHLRNALKAVGKEDPGVIRYYLAQALLLSTRADDLLEAKSLFDALDAESALPDGHPLQPLRAEVQANAAARAAVRQLDEGSQEGISSLASVIQIGERTLPWLVHGFADFARTAPLAALERRLKAIQGILALDAAAMRSLSAISPPESGSSREAWLEFAPRLSDWWDKRR